MAKFELLKGGTYYKDHEYEVGDTVDFGDEVDVKLLEEMGLIGPVGTLKKQEKVEAPSEPNVSSQDGPQVTKRAYNRRK